MLGYAVQLHRPRSSSQHPVSFDLGCLRGSTFRGPECSRPNKLRADTSHLRAHATLTYNQIVACKAYSLHPYCFFASSGNLSQPQVSESLVIGIALRQLRDLLGSEARVPGHPA
jgi:hypothetical protein